MNISNYITVIYSYLTLTIFKLFSFHIKYYKNIILESEIVLNFFRNILDLKLVVLNKRSF